MFQAWVFHFIFDSYLTIPYNNRVEVDKGYLMYTVLFPSGKTLSFTVLALAETYVQAYKGVLLSNPQECKVITEVV
jgi:hypothetical protein